MRNQTWCYFSFFAFVCLVIIPVGFSQTAETIRVVSEGYGISHKEALLKAKRNAIEQGIGAIIISETEMKNFTINKDMVLTRTIGSVKKFSVLKKEVQSDGVNYVKIDATVSLAAIKEDLAALKILLESMDRPRMMVMIQEQGGSAAESAILDFLTQKNFDLVDAAQVAALMSKNDQLVQNAVKGDPAAAAKIGAANGAEYIIVGRVDKSVGENEILKEAGMTSGQAHLTAKVINCSNARIIASKSANSAAAHISKEIATTKAAEKAAQKLMDKKLFEQIISSFQDMLNNGMAIDVVIVGVKNFKMQKNIKNFISQMNDAVSTNRRSFSGGKLVLSVNYKGNSDTFAENIDGQKAGGRTFTVTDIIGSKIVIQMTDN